LDVSKYSLRSSLDLDLFKGLTANFQISLNNGSNNTLMNPADKNNAENMEETFRALLQNPKWIPPTVNVNGQDLPVYQYGEISNNPYAIWDNNNYRKGESNSSNYVARLNYKLPWVDGLSVSMQFSQTKNSSKTKNYYARAYAYNFQTRGQHAHIVVPTLADSLPKEQISGTEYLEEDANFSSSYQFNANISYSKKFGLHDISALLIYEQSESESNKIGWKREGAQVMEGVDELWAFEEKDIISATNVNKSGSLGYIGRLN
jgi:hypothetical protein